MTMACHSYNVFLTGSETYEDEDSIRERLHAIMKSESCFRPWTLIQSGRPGAEQLALSIAEKLDWTVITEPVNTHGDHAHRDYCRRILARYKPSHVATFRQAEYHNEDTTDLLGCSFEIERYKKLSSTRLKSDSHFEVSCRGEVRGEKCRSEYHRTMSSQARPAYLYTSYYYSINDAER